jgi:peptide/nickel transport system ATP-binding protein
MTGRGAPGPAGRPLIEVRGLRVDYGFGPGAVHAVIDADLTLAAGAVLGLAGESGSGKSTLAYAMTRLLRTPGVITAGQVLLHGTGTADGPAGAVDLLAADEGQLRQLRWSAIAVVMQSAMHALNPVITIGAQLTDVLEAHRQQMSKTDRRERAAFLLEMVGISAGHLGHYPHQLSGGMRQRVMIAMALALEPAVVIMDEPTTALDVVTQREILQELAELQRELSFAVLFITHDLSLLVELADSIAVMYAGRLLEQAAASDLYRAPRHPYTLGLLRSFPPLHGERRPLTGIPGSPPDLRTPPPGCPFHPRCGFAMDVCRAEVPVAIPLGRAGERSAACWLHGGTHDLPAELAVPEPGAAPGPAAGTEPAGPAAGAEPGAPGAAAGTESGAAPEAGVRTGTAVPDAVAGAGTGTAAGTGAGAGTKSAAAPGPGAGMETGAAPGPAAGPEATARQLAAATRLGEPTTAQDATGAGP